MPNTYSTIIYTQIGGLAKVEFNRPKQLNAINVLMIKELSEAIDTALASGSGLCC